MRVNNPTLLFIEKAKAIHGDRYDYSKTIYYKYTLPIEINCPKHGIFSVTPKGHIKGAICRECRKEERLTGIIYDYGIKTNKAYIEKCTIVHNGKYTYEHTIYNGNMRDKVIINCTEHGKFTQIAVAHLRGRDCPKCIDDNSNKTMVNLTAIYIAKAIKVHGSKYDYSNTVYIRNNENITITCPIHGKFKQSAKNHLKGSGCLKCSIVLRKNKLIAKGKNLTTAVVVERAKKTHGDKYDYSKVVYVSPLIGIVIGCKKHGDFTQNVFNHIRGQGCPGCANERIRNKK